MSLYENALELSKAQTKATSEAAQAVSACVSAMMEASAAFAKTSAERNMELATTLLGAKSLENAAEIHGAFVRESMRASSAMAMKIADACTEAAKQCSALAAKAMTGANGASQR